MCGSNGNLSGPCNLITCKSQHRLKESPVEERIVGDTMSLHCTGGGYVYMCLHVRDDEDWRCEISEKAHHHHHHHDHHLPDLTTIDVDRSSAIAESC